ncbi:MAG: baseplate J/gp47 family protein, partial [Kiritimatiellia bacterium]
MICETAGIEGGQYIGNIVPINYIDGLETASLTALLIPGENEETTEDLRTRYYVDASANKAFGGNTQDYLLETNAIEGVGACKVTPVWNGAGTVKLTILAADYNKASATLIASVQAAIDPPPQGEGRGIAPIGHTVTVDAPGETTVNVTVTLEFDTGYSWAILQTAINEVMTAYLLELRQAWANAANVIIRVAQIETRLLTITGIVDVANTVINGTAANLT